MLLILIAQVEPYHLRASQSTKLLMDNSKVGTVGRVGLPALAHDVVTGRGGREREGEGEGRWRGEEEGGGRTHESPSYINKQDRKDMKDQQINDQLNPTSTT